MDAPRSTPNDQPRAQADIDQLCINTIRTLTIDAVQKANSGHAGAPMGLAPVAYTLWQEVLRYDPDEPLWPNRDRFVLSCGHASMLLYSLIHLSGIKRLKDGKATDKLAVTLDDIEHFRQIDSVTPGHPEYGHTTGVETTTGPLGQGCGNSVGMAIASRWLGAHYNKPGHTIFDFNVYNICSDGDMMEGVASEAASLAGHLGLDNLCWIYDSNTVTIEGHTELAFDENVAERFRGYGWHVTHVADANDCNRVRATLEEFRETKGRPTLIIVNSVIGYGAPDMQGTSKIHSDALGADEVKKTKAFLGFPQDKDFYVPDGVREHFHAGIGQRGAAARAAWEKGFAQYAKEYHREAGQIERCLRHGLPENWASTLPVFKPDAKGIATREASGKVLNAIAEELPWVLGGAADLAPSTKTRLTSEGMTALEKATPGGRNMHFGIREHGMGAIVNGMGLCHLRAFGATFLIFSDYMRPPIRLAALMRLPIFHVFTHDSIGVGEDGPTHQPIEQLAGLRAIPNLVVLRPADANEVREAYKVIFSLKDEPAALILSRQALPIFDRGKYASASGVARGAYVMADSDGEPQVILIGTGSEVQLCVAAFEELKSRGIRARVVSMPSWDLFEKQDKSYRDTVLPPHITARVAVEQGSTIGWDRYAGPSGAIIGMHTFGASAPLKDLLKKFGFTPDKVVEAALHQIEQNKAS
ncbi:MAG: transketolase [Bradyrhizobiaceae bacterium]|nr:MAG: transketolase [Bradyrhizobiaceae bacterium]